MKALSIKKLKYKTKYHSIFTNFYIFVCHEILFLTIVTTNNRTKAWKIYQKTMNKNLNYLKLIKRDNRLTSLQKRLLITIIGCEKYKSYSIEEFEESFHIYNQLRSLFEINSSKSNKNNAIANNN